MFERDQEDFEYHLHLMAMGNHFGYPKCCTESFINRMDAYAIVADIGGQILWDDRQLAGTGFIPCSDCDSKTEEELIVEINSNRLDVHPFDPKNLYNELVPLDMGQTDVRITEIVDGYAESLGIEL